MHTIQNIPDLLDSPLLGRSGGTCDCSAPPHEEVQPKEPNPEPLAGRGHTFNSLNHKLSLNPKP